MMFHLGTEWCIIAAVQQPGDGNRETKTHPGRGLQEEKMALIGKDEFVKAWLVYLKEGHAVLSRRHYESWWEIQDEFGDRFVSNRAITDDDCAEQVMRYMAADFKEGRQPFGREDIEAFFAGAGESIEA